MLHVILTILAIWVDVGVTILAVGLVHKALVLHLSGTRKFVLKKGFTKWCLFVMTISPILLLGKCIEIICNVIFFITFFLIYLVMDFINYPTCIYNIILLKKLKGVKIEDGKNSTKQSY